VRISVPIRAASTAALAAAAAAALLAAPALATPAQAASGSSASKAVSSQTAAGRPATVARSARLPLTAAQLQADRRRQDAAQAATSSLTGLARTAAGQPLIGICVTAYSKAGDKSAVTGRNGRFMISGLSAGKYRVEYRSCAGGTRQYLPEWYGDILQRAESQVVTVYGSTLAPTQALKPVTLYPANSTLGDLPDAVVPQQGSTELASDPFGRIARPPSSPANLMKSLVARYLPRVTQTAHSSRPGRISGVVTSPKGQGLRGICVEVAGPTEFLFTSTGKDGSYHASGLPAGKYFLAFYADCGNTGNWLFQIYKNIYNEVKRPTTVKVAAGRTTGHVSVVMKEGGEISGTVTGPGGRKLNNICVYPLTNSVNSLPVFNAVSGNGVYHIRGVSPGAYQIGFASCGLSNWAPTLWPDTQNYHSAPYINMHGTRHVGNIDEIMQPGGIVTGTVTAATNPPAPLAGMCAIVFENNGLMVTGSAATSATGSYEIFGLAAGSYSVEFYPGCNNNGNYVGINYPNNVNVVGGATTSGINGALPIGATISGRVTSAVTGQPVRGICVSINSTESSEFDDQSGFETTNRHGTYSANQLPVGSYQIQFSGGCGNAGSYAPQGWDKTYVLDPQNLNVTAAGENVTGIGAALQPGPVISGTVTNSAGHKLGGICVEVGTPAGALFGFGQTGGGGRYQVPDLAPGSYEVVFSPGCGNNADLAEEAFRSQVSGAADTVSATSGTLSGIDAVMQPAGGISGVVRAANGHPVQFSCIYLTGVSGPAKSLAGEAFIFGRKYDFTGLPLGGYQVTFLPTCLRSALESQWYKDKPSPAGATTVVIRAFHTDPQIDSLLRIGGSIAGRITSGGKPVRNMCVYAQNVSVFADFGAATSNRNGQYDIHGLNTGAYELEVEPCGTGSNTLAAEVLPQLVNVTAPGRTSGVKTTAVAGGTISGRVLVSPPPADAGAAGACVEAFETNGDAYNANYTGLDGTFSIANLPPGQYRVFVGDPGCSFSEPNLAPQWYLGEANEITATPVSLTAGGTTTLSTVTLANDGSIGGSVTGQGGKPLQGVCVAATAAGSVPVYSVTSSAGSYSIADLPAGRYRVQFSSGCGASGYHTQWWRDKPTAKAATLVTVTAATPTTGISAALKK
jgi:hypothetical protein